MSKSKPRGRKSGASASSRLGVVKPAIPGGSEIATSMQRLADHIDHLPSELARRVVDGPTGSQQRSGAEVTDAGLLAPASSARTAGVLSIDAFPHPDGSGRVSVRLDGWEGSLVITLTPDRAALLANRLSEAVDKTKAWFGG